MLVGSFMSAVDMNYIIVSAEIGYLTDTTGICIAVTTSGLNTFCKLFVCKYTGFFVIFHFLNSLQLFNSKTS